MESEGEGRKGGGLICFAFLPSQSRTGQEALEFLLIQIRWSLWVRCDAIEVTLSSAPLGNQTLPRLFVETDELKAQVQRLCHRCAKYPSCCSSGLVGPEKTDVTTPWGSEGVSQSLLLLTPPDQNC